MKKFIDDLALNRLKRQMLVKSLPLTQRAPSGTHKSMNEATSNHEQPPRRDIKSALLLIIIGAAFAWKGSSHSFGELSRIGPGFFPVALGLIMVGLGLLLLLVPALGSAEQGDAESDTGVDIRAWGFVVGGVVAFIVLGRYGGLVPATFALVALAAAGDRSNSLRTILLTAAAMTLIAVLVFWLLLGVQFPLFSWAR